jgi:hypothetical protein
MRGDSDTITLRSNSMLLLLLLLLLMMMMTMMMLPSLVFVLALVQCVCVFVHAARLTHVVLYRRPACAEKSLPTLAHTHAHAPAQHPLCTPSPAP